MATGTAALLISILSLVVSFVALGWTIYRELALKARVKTSLSIGEWHTPAGSQKKIIITASNLGPGPVQIQGFTVGDPPRGKLPVNCHILPIEWEHPINTRLPALLNVGQTLSLVVKCESDSFLAAGASRIGLKDSFGRTHWTPRRDGQNALKDFHAAFPDQPVRPN